MRTRIHHNRPGFTLVELLVATALIVLIMTVISYAFQQGMDTVSHVKSIGDLQSRLRSASTVLRDDLQSHHLDSDYGSRVSDQRMDLVTLAATPSGTAAWTPPRGGFFRILQEAQPTSEGYDSDGIQSSRANNHILHFTVKRSASRPDKVFRAAVPSIPSAAAWWTTNGTLATCSLLNMQNSRSEMVSSWAEIAYYVDTQNQTGTTPTGLPMYPLVRRVRVLATGTTGINWQTACGTLPNMTAYQGISFSPQSKTVNGPAEIAVPANRLGGAPSRRIINATDTPTYADTLSGEKQDQSGTPVATGADILLTNVISFEIRPTWEAPSGGTIAQPRAFTTNVHTDAPFDDLPLATPNATTGVGTNHPVRNMRVFDTWHRRTDDPATTNVREDELWRTAGNDDAVPNLIRVKAIQIKIRIFDTKNKMTRQITIIHDM